MFNQFLLTELIRAQSRAEQERKIQEEVLRPLAEKGISIDDLVISGSGSLQEVFHASTIYHHIGRTATDNLPYKSLHLNRSQGKLDYIDLTLEIFQISIAGSKGDAFFNVAINHKDIIFPFPYEQTRSSLQKLEKLEAYLLQRQAAQQPEYNYTYRTRTEIKP